MRLLRAFAIFLFVLLAVASTGHAFLVKGPDKTIDLPSYALSGTEYLPLSLVCDAYGVAWNWDPTLSIVELNKGNAKLKLMIGVPKVYVNGQMERQDRPMLMYNGTACVPSKFLKTVFNRYFTAGSYSIELPPSEPSSLSTWTPQAPSTSFHRINKIILDTGHGGYDPGAIGRGGLREKNIVLDISRQVRDMLKNEGIEVVMTRSDDTFIPLWGRVDITNRSNADLFVSIHANASRSRRLKGFEAYYLSEALDDTARAENASENASLKFERESIYRGSPDVEPILWDLKLTEDRRDSIELGHCVLDEVGASRRELKSARFYVLKGARIPAVLLEVGYITNKDDSEKLRDGEYRTQLARQITNGIISYKKRFEGLDGFTH